jgi:nucleoside-diphosphate-sugar epimerase
MLRAVSEHGQGTRVAVTGAGGFVGRALCRRLVADGFDVLGLDVAEAAEPLARAAGAEFRRADTTDRAGLDAALAGVQLVAHTAAVVGDWGPRELYERVNVGGTGNVIDAATAAGVSRVVHISSVAIWGYEFTRDIGEDEPPRPCGNPYIDTKGESELLALSKGATVVRPGDVYGPESTQWVVRPLELARRGRLLVPGRGEGILTLVYIDDLVDCVVRALTDPAAGGHAFTAWDGEPVTLREYYDHFGRMTGRRVRSAPLGLALAVGGVQEAVARVRRKPPDFTRASITFLSRQAVYPNARARELLGWEPRVTLGEGMRRVEEWARASGLLDPGGA